MISSTPIPASAARNLPRPNSSFTRICQLLQIDFDKFQDLTQQFPEAKKLTELIRDHYKQQTQQRLYDLTHKKNKQIYDEFKAEHKDLLYSLCQYKLATYLGMSYPTFARLHNQR